MTEQTTESGDAFEAVLNYVKESRGFDFTGYKRTSLKRRVQRRMTQVGIDNYADYVDYLQVNSEEFVALFNTILINVTGFFRDSDTWEYLRDEVVPLLLAERGPDDPIRVWSAGCASGQEAYSIAMLLADTMGMEEFKQRVKIYATDVDDEALNQARHASYTSSEVEGLPTDKLDTYFEQHGGRYVFRKDLRRSVIFGRNDLVQDAPISRVDLLACRNTLMYFNAETQTKILDRFHFALGPKGMLFLGKAEMLLSHTNIFEPLDLKRRVFHKAARAPESYAHLAPPTIEADRGRSVGGLEQLREHAFDMSPVAQVVVNADEVIALANQEAGTMFGVSPHDVGKSLRDHEVSYRPVALRGYVEQARMEHKALQMKDVQVSRGGETLWYEIHFNPLLDGANQLTGVAIVLHDVTATRQLRGELEQVNRQLESAYEEMQSTNEELETTNEELQSTVEELETTNEELQSTNEELETMNEELQSTNDELQTINDTLRERTLELDEVNDFLESILTSFRAAVVVVDLEMRVRVWNRAAENLWGLRREEAEGQHLLNLDIGLPLQEIQPPVRDALTDAGYQTELSLDAVNRRGRETTVRLVCGSMLGSEGASQGALLVMEQNGQLTS